MENKFKAGEDAWYFEFPEDGCGGFDVNAIELCVTQDLTKIETEQGYLKYAYKSKSEALAAIAERIKEFKDKY